MVVKKPKALTRNERTVFAVFEWNSGDVLSRAQIFRTAFPGRHFDGLTNLIDVYVWSIRLKLGREIVRTVHGRGYIYEGKSGSSSYYGA